MGYWGTGIFESDYALCTLGDLVGPFVNLIEKNASNPNTSEWDDILIDELAISAKILITLKDAGFPLECLPSSKILIGNRNSFAKAWRSNPETSDFQNERLTKILEVWDEMIIVSVNHEKSRG